jgi:hypothetical protein
MFPGSRLSALAAASGRAFASAAAGPNDPPINAGASPGRRAQGHWKLFTS